jgi:hypothetical protein
VLPDRSLELSSRFTGEFRVEISSKDGSSLGSKSGEIRPEDSLIVVHLDIETSPHRFRVVDPKGLPVPHVRLRLYSLDATHLQGVEDSGEDGQCSVAGLITGPYRAYMDHPGRGYDLGKLVDVPPYSEDPIEIVFSPENAIELQLMDGLDPLPAVSCRLVEDHVSYTLPAAASDATGVVCWKAIGSGRFRVQVQQAGLWPPDASVEALPAGQRTEVQVRRLGDLDVSLARASGGSTAGMVLELESFEFQTSVATWIAEGRVTSSTGSLATDVQGRLSLTGLPRGTYAWSAEEQGGTVDVFPGRRDKLTVFMP